MRVRPPRSTVSSRKPARTRFLVSGSTSATLDSEMGASMVSMPPALPCWPWRTWRVFRLMPSTRTLPSAGNTWMTRPCLPLSPGVRGSRPSSARRALRSASAFSSDVRPRTTSTRSFLRILAAMDQITSGARETIRMNFLSRSSRPTGPKIRVPRGSPLLLMMTAAFSSKRM